MSIMSSFESTAKEMLPGWLDRLESFARKKYGEHLVITREVFAEYLSKSYEHYNTFKNILDPYESRCIVGENSIYIRLPLEGTTGDCNTDSARDLLEIKNLLLILGTGGAGKTMLMRYLFLEAVHSHKFIPVFIELRDAQDLTEDEYFTDGCIMKLIVHAFRGFNVKIGSTEQMEFALSHGGFLFLFDGLDEIPTSKSNRLARSLAEFSRRFDNNGYIISSRYEPYHTFETFKTLRTKKLDKPAALEMAQRFLAWPSADLKSFIKDLDEKLFDEYKDLAINPLLLSIMFITYCNNQGVIPEKNEDFYGPAFDALYERHDLENKGYKRQFHCSELHKEDFKRIFGHFCFHSQYEERYEFSKADLLDRLQKSISVIGNDSIDAGKFLLDLRDNLCMLVEDGYKYRFSHRTFQSYFCALYLSHLEDLKQKEFYYKSMKKDGVLEAVAPFAFQFEKNRFIKNCVIRNIKHVIRHGFHYKDFIIEMYWINNGLKSFDPTLSSDAEHVMMHLMGNNAYFVILEDDVYSMEKFIFFNTLLSMVRTSGLDSVMATCFLRKIQTETANQVTISGLGVIEIFKEFLAENPSLCKMEEKRDSVDDF